MTSPEGKAVPRGEFPEGHVLKAFSERDHAESFLNLGRFRMGSLASYREIEDATRKDSREGQGFIRVHGEVTVGHFAPGKPDYFEASIEEGLQHHHMQMGNPIYIFSTSLKDVDVSMLRSRWPYIVCISDPRQLAIDISEYLQLRPGFRAGVEGRLVRYDHGEVVEDVTDDWERLAISYYQKPADFSEEREFRLVAIDSGNNTQREHHTYLEIDLGYPIEYASLLEE